MTHDIRFYLHHATCVKAFVSLFWSFLSAWRRWVLNSLQPQLLRRWVSYQLNLPPPNVLGHDLQFPLQIGSRFAFIPQSATGACLFIYWTDTVDIFKHLNRCKKSGNLGVSSGVLDVFTSGQLSLNSNTSLPQNLSRRRSNVPNYAAALAKHSKWEKHINW